MSQLAPAILRHVRLLSGSRAATGPAILMRGARYSSQNSPSPMSSYPTALSMKDMLGKVLDFKGSLPGNKSPADKWTERSNNLNLSSPLNTWSGRRVSVRDGDLQNAFQQLNMRLRQNQVAKEVALSVRHEKKGDKRARLRSERWRRRFADAVRKKVQLVSTIRRRGG